jgi:Caspase domain
MRTRRLLVQNAALIIPYLALSSCTTVSANGRPSHLALTIGVSYRSSGNASAILPNTVADAALVARAFNQSLPEPRQVVEIHDPSYASLDQALNQVRASIDRSSIVFIYYAGHGVQIGTENYLVTDDLLTLINMNSVIEYFQGIAHGVAFILDACRNNPFAQAGASARQVQVKSLGARNLTIIPVEHAARTSGLARVSVRGAQIMVAFATDPGDVADDAAYPGAANGPFALAFSENLTRSSDLAQALTGTAAALASRAQPRRRAQTPWIQSSWTAPISLAGQQTEALPPP